MAIAGFLDGMCLTLRASGLWLRYATLQNLIPSFPWIAPPRLPPWHNQILPSGNTGHRDRVDGVARNAPAGDPDHAGTGMNGLDSLCHVGNIATFGEPSELHFANHRFELQK